MHNGNRIVASVLACCLALIVTAGCSNSKPRQAGQNIIDKITKAQELGNRAMALMANTAFEDTVSQKFTPTIPNEAKASSKDDIRLLPPTAVNPQAIEPLKVAYTELNKAIADNPDAPAQIIDLGYITLGRLAAIMGDYNAYAARANAAQAAINLTDARNTLELLYAQADVVSALAGLSTVADAKLPDIIAGINTDVQKAEKKKTDAANLLDASRTKLKGLRAIYDNQILKMTELRRQSDDLAATDRQKGLKVFDEATKALIEAMKINAEISVTERTIAVQEAALRTTEQELTATQTKLNAINEIQKSQDAAAGTAKAAQTAAMNKALAIQDDFKAKIAMLAENLQAMKKSSAQAGTEYERAIKNFADAATMAKKDDLSDERYNEALIGQASTTASMANHSLADLAIHPLISDLLTRTDAAFTLLGAEVPPDVKKVKELLVAAPAEVSQTAADKYEEAAKIYGKITSVPLEQKWSYDSLQAAAYSQVYLNSGKEQQKNSALDTAAKLLLSATKGRENSPYLADVVRLKNMMTSGGATSSPAGTPEAPVPAPAAPTPPSEPAPTPVPAAPDAPADNK